MNNHHKSHNETTANWELVNAHQDKAPTTHVHNRAYQELAQEELARLRRRKGLGGFIRKLFGKVA